MKDSPNTKYSDAVVVDVKNLLEDLPKLRQPRYLYFRLDTRKGWFVQGGAHEGKVEVPAGVARASMFDLSSENNRVDLRSDNTNRVGVMAYSGL